MTNLPSLLRQPAPSRHVPRAALLVAAALCALSCGDDDNQGFPISPAQQSGIGAACRTGVNTDCAQSPVALQCLDFKGGYCGLQGCTRAEDCPFGSACVSHSDGQSYCFLICIDKIDCNATRPVDIESNCSANVDFIGGEAGKKACVPPS